METDARINYAYFIVGYLALYDVVKPSVEGDVDVAVQLVSEALEAVGLVRKNSDLAPVLRLLPKE